MVLAAMRAGLAISPPPELKPGSRPAYDKLMAQVLTAALIETSPAEVGGTSGWWCRPANAALRQVILYLHGGGYVIGSAAAYPRLGEPAQLRPAAAAVFSPMIDATLSSRSLETRADRDHILTRETLQMALQFYR